MCLYIFFRKPFKSSNYSIKGVLLESIHFFKLPEGLRTPRLVGALLFVIGLVLFFQTGAQMFETWDNLKYVKACYSAKQNVPNFQEDCSFIAKNLLNISPRPDQSVLNLKQMFVAFSGSLAAMFFWIIVIILSVGLYESEKIVIPIQKAMRKVEKK